MGKGSSAPATTTTTTTNEPWAEAKPYYNDLYARAQALSKAGTENYYPQSTVVDWSKQTTDAVKQQEALARDPMASTMLNNAAGATNNILTGGAYSATPTNTFNSLQGNLNTGSNPMLNTFNAFASGSQRGGFGGTAQLQNMANYSNPGVGATAMAAGTISNDAANKLNANGGFTNAAMSGQQAQAAQLAGATNTGAQMLQSTANGDFLKAGNPYLTDYISQTLQPIQSDYQNLTAKNASSFAGAGRLGSQAYANAVNTTDENASKGMANAATNLAYQNYNNERDKQIAAQTQIGNFYNSDVANSANALANLAGTSNSQQGLRNDALTSSGNLQNAFSQLGLSAANQLGQQSVAQAGVQKGALDSLQSQYNQDTANQLTGAQAGAATWNNDVQNMLAGKNINLNAATAQAQNDATKAGQQLSAANAAGSIYDNLYKPVDQLKNVGAAYEQQQGAYLQDMINRWTAENNSGWTDLQNQANIMSNGGYGSSTGTSTQPVYSNSGAQVMGGIASGVGALGKLAKCDIRLKKNIELIGHTLTGIPLYNFTYIADETQKIYVGPMAQEVQELLPEAVVTTEDGFLAVNLETIGEAQKQSSKYTFHGFN